MAEPDPVFCEGLRNLTTPPWRAKVENRPLGAQIQIGLFATINSLLWIFIVAFAILKYIHPLRSKLHRIKHRNFFLICLTHMGAAFVTVTGSWYQSQPLSKGLPCWVYLTMYFLQVPLLTFPIVTRLLAFYRAEQWTAVVRSAREQQEQDDNKSVGTMESEQTHTSMSTNAVELLKTVVRVVFCRARVDSLSARQVRQGSTGVAPDAENIAAAQKDRKDQIRVMRFFNSKTGSYLTLVIVFIPYLITVGAFVGTSAFVANGCMGCTPSRAEDAALIAESVFALLLLIFSYRLNLKKNDPFGLVQEIRMVVWFGGAPAVLFLILQISLRNLTQGDFQFTMLIEISLLIYCFIQSGLQCILAFVEYHREQRDLQGVKYSLSEFQSAFVENTGYFHDAFCRHLASEHGYESVAFLDAVLHWEKTYFDMGPKTSRTRAKKIANMYIGDHAELPCNLPSNCVRLIEIGLAKQETDLPYDFFRQAKAEIVSMLYRDSFKRFLRSKEYKALNEQLGSRTIVNVVPGARPETTKTMTSRGGLV